MVDPVTGAVAGAIANHSVAAVKEYIESSEDPEAVWEESLYEIAVKIRTAHQQDKRRPKQDQFDRELRRYSDMLRELAVRGDIRGFNQSNIELVESIADGIPEVRGSKKYTSKTMAGEYERQDLNEYVDECIERFGPGSR